MHGESVLPHMHISGLSLVNNTFSSHRLSGIGKMALFDARRIVVDTPLSQGSTWQQESFENSILTTRAVLS